MKSCRKRFFILEWVAVGLAFTAISAQAEITDSDRTAFIRRLDSKAEHYAKLSKKIWVHGTSWSE